jgi:ectoine hydroxylase-related dioxygenase (phytanoyl-CoA dioxygenase family)
VEQLLTKARPLSDAELRRFSDEGYVAPIRVLTRVEARAYRTRIEDFIDGALAAESGTDVLRTKAHLRCPALLELVHRPSIVEPVANLLGPDLLCRSVSVFLKEAGDSAFVAWHQDAAYWALEPPDVATAWLALTESTRESGALQVLPGSHREPLLAHDIIDDPHNMLSRGQSIIAPIDASQTRSVILDVGEMSIHHVRLAHGSAPNRSTDRRIGVAIRYVAAHVRKTGRRRDSAMLICGIDRFGNFDPEPG